MQYLIKSHTFKTIALAFPILAFSITLSIAISSSTVHAGQIPPPPPLAVKAYVLKDFNSNMIVAEQNGSGKVEPASLTKLMTAYVVFSALQNGHLQLSQTLPVSEKAWKTEGSKMFIEPNKPVTVDELLHGMIIVSGNDASVALAEGVASTEELFAGMMNKQAARLGMINTHFMNATGLPDAQHYTTAHDLSLLASALIRDFPSEYKRLYAIKEYCYPNVRTAPEPPLNCKKNKQFVKDSCYFDKNGELISNQPEACKLAQKLESQSCNNKCLGITQLNRNRLLWADPTVDGMKTGHTESAGFCLISSAKRGGAAQEHRFISVVLGAPNDSARATESQKLLNFGFQFYDATLVYKKAQPINIAKVWKGRANTVNAIVTGDLYLTLPKGEYARVKATITSQQPLIAPVAKGQVIGKINFILDNKIIGSHNLVAAQDVAIAGAFGRLWDSFKLLFQ